MRKFIVKHFALSYSIKIGKWNISAVRASRIIFPLFVATGFALTYTGWNIVTILLGVLTIISLFLGFVYFEIFPVKYRELDPSQKKQVAVGIMTGQISMVLTSEEWEEVKLLYYGYN